MKSKAFENWMTSVLRMASYKWLPRNKVLKAARVSHGRYKCNMCGQIFAKKDIQMDHVVPVVDPQKGFPRLDNGQANWNEYIDRLFVSEAGWQVVCKECHAKKTAEENAVRKEKRNER